MNVKLKVLTAGAIFFLGSQAVMAQQKSDSVKTKTIEEVVVTGYKSKRLDEISQAQSIVSGAELKQQAPTLSLTNMLQGKAPGVFVQTSSGKPGDAGVINIRGLANISGTQPLIVIDGNYSSVAQLNALNPSDVESQVILKDAAATAQYGSKASAGVIVVTTRRGVAGKTQYSFETRYGFSKKVSDKELNFEMMNSTQKLAWENEVATYGVGNTPWTPTEVAELTAQDHNWQNDVLRTSAEESYLFSANGGDNKNLFYYSLGYDKNTGIIKYLTGLKRYTGRFNFESQLSDKLRIGLNTGLQYQELQNQRDRNNGQNPIRFMYDANPYETIFLPDGTYNPTNGSGFPILEALQNNTGENRDLRLTGLLFGEYKITNWLKTRSTFSGNFGQLKTENIIKPKSYLDVILGLNGQLSIANNDFFNYVYNQRFDFNKKIENHNFDLTGLFEYNSQNSNTLTATGRNFRTPGLYVLSNMVTPFTTAGARTQYRSISYAALFDYNYASKYILSASIRRDGSSKFGLDSQWGNFWSASAAWNIAKENFMSNSNFKTLKLRGSYGTVGNDAPIPNYVNQEYVSFGIYGTGATTVVPIATGNRNVEWEKAEMLNAGVEFNYANRIRGSVEYFDTKRKDFLQVIPNPVETGSYTLNDNAGDLQNKGIEVELSADIIKKDKWLWSLRGNYTNVENKVLSLKPGENERIVGGGLNIHVVGETPYLFRLVKYAGVDSNTGESLYYTNRTTPNANETFSTVNGKTVTNVYSTSDIQTLYDKSPFPKAFGGFGTTLTYGKLDVNADFAYKFGGYTMNYMALNMLDSSQYYSNKRTDAINFWRNPGDTNVYAAPSVNGLYDTDQFLQKSDYIRFRNLNVGYTFDKNFLGENVPLSSVRVYASAQNLYIWTNYEGDPEASIGSGESNTDVPNSYSLYTYPTTKTYTVGIELNF